MCLVLGGVAGGLLGFWWGGWGGHGNQQTKELLQHKYPLLASRTEECAAGNYPHTINTMTSRETTVKLFVLNK